ncbi:hypothetical protein [Paraburkholderia piptadeniae]|uniref:hypothetical protein n=1 Tax=Paraburkholderia piptadeniae TaxID=1701573 RepID=UPI000B3F945C|nr:hypothetical protein [Paraburkholderia piptadeniae]
MISAISTVLNFIGLTMMAFGGIGAAWFSPASHPDPDWAVDHIGEQRVKRVVTHHSQKLVKPCFALVGVGALFQLAAMAF